MPYLTYGCNLRSRALLDHNPLTVRGDKVDGTERGGNVKWLMMHVAKTSHAIGTDFIGDITVSSNAIGTHNGQIDLSLSKETRRGAVANDRNVNSITRKLPSG
jgi:hypothetical protein